ncbi:MAG: enoyl-CoA hydratase, partial [Solirubrobacterales bacterium]|nr:enoyl-CoA hydratase [Solirubrobacterales bacterium]
MPLAAGTFIPMCADSRIGLDGDFEYGLNEVKIGLTMPLFVQELARQRLTPAEFSRATITAHSYSPTEAVA